MSAPNPTDPTDPLDAVEAHLGRALAIIHRVLPRLDEAGHQESIQSALQQAGVQVEAARAMHARTMATSGTASVEPEDIVFIAAAVAAVLDRPHRILDVQKVGVPVHWVNAWAIEGRFQHYSSHKVR